MNERPRIIKLPAKHFENKKTKQKIRSTLCAFFNTKHGGTIEFRPEERPWSDEDKFKRCVEQKIQVSAGTNYLCNKTSWDSGKDGKLLITVEQTDELHTVDYNLYLASDTQVLSLKSGDTNVEDVRTILTKRQIPKEKAKVLGTHRKTFVQKTKLGLSESKKIQLKMFKCEKTPNVGLRKRISNNKNKVVKTISAFANTYGGDIYCGITDDKDILGESIADNSEKEKITAAVAKAINSMVWPQEHGKPKRGEQWEIYFEPVKDHEGNDITNCFVIVISVAPSPVGVFAEQPESYYIGDKGQVEKMPFEMWKAKVFATATSREEQVNESPQQADETVGSKAESLGWPILKSKEMKASRQQSQGIEWPNSLNLTVTQKDNTRQQHQEMDGLNPESSNSSSPTVTQKDNTRQQYQEMDGLNPETSNSSSPTVIQKDNILQQHQEMDGLNPESPKTTQDQYTRLNEKFDRLRENGEWELFWNEIQNLRESEIIDVQLIVYYQITCATYMHKELTKCKKFRKEFKKLITKSENSSLQSRSSVHESCDEAFRRGLQRQRYASFTSCRACSHNSTWFNNSVGALHVCSGNHNPGQGRWRP